MSEYQPSSTNGASTDASSRTPQPLKVVVVGAGIGGLFAAIALRAAGHHVEIYESSRFAMETGAAIHIPPNVNGLLRRYGLIPEDHRAVTCEWVSEEMPNGDVKFRRNLEGLKHAFAYPWQLIHRIDLHNALKNIAKDEKGDGKPVVIHLQSRVTSVDIEKTSITLQDGQVVTGDLILGADGVHASLILSSSILEIY
jgi:salicylate hydroxylase